MGGYKSQGATPGMRFAHIKEVKKNAGGKKKYYCHGKRSTTAMTGEVLLR